MQEVVRNDLVVDMLTWGRFSKGDASKHHITTTIALFPYQRNFSGVDRPGQGEWNYFEFIWNQRYPDPGCDQVELNMKELLCTNKPVSLLLGCSCIWFRASNVPRLPFLSRNTLAQIRERRLRVECRVWYLLHILNRVSAN